MAKVSRLACNEPTLRAVSRTNPNPNPNPYPNPNPDQVLCLAPFDSEEEAIALANDTEYGLTSYVQTADTARVRRVSRALRAGMVEVNGKACSAGAPFGGVKQSGNGREGGEMGLKEFLEVKTISG